MAHYSFSAKCTLRLFSASIFHFIFILFSFISTISSIFPHRLKNLSISTCVHITSPVLQQLSTATPIHQLQAAPWPNSHPKEPKLNLKSIWVWYQMRLGSIFPPLCVESKMCCISIYYISILKHTLEPRERGCEDREDFSGKHHPGWGEPPLSSIQRFLPCFLPTGSWPAGQLHHGLPDRHLPSWRWAWRLQWTLPARWHLGKPAGLSSSACTTVQNWGLWSCPVPCTSPALSGGTQPSRLSLNRQPAEMPGEMLLHDRWDSTCGLPCCFHVWPLKDPRQCSHQCWINPPKCSHWMHFIGIIPRASGNNAFCQKSIRMKPPQQSPVWRATFQEAQRSMILSACCWPLVPFVNIRIQLHTRAENIPL